MDVRVSLVSRFLGGGKKKEERLLRVEDSENLLAPLDRSHICVLRHHNHPSHRVLYLCAI